MARFFDQGGSKPDQISGENPVFDRLSQWTRDGAEIAEYRSPVHGNGITITDNVGPNAKIVSQNLPDLAGLDAITSRIKILKKPASDRKFLFDIKDVTRSGRMTYSPDTNDITMTRGTHRVLRQDADTIDILMDWDITELQDTATWFELFPSLSGTESVTVLEFDAFFLDESGSGEADVTLEDEPAFYDSMLGNMYSNNSGEHEVKDEFTPTQTGDYDFIKELAVTSNSISVDLGTTDNGKDVVDGLNNRLTSAQERTIETVTLAAGTKYYIRAWAGGSTGLSGLRLKIRLKDYSRKTWTRAEDVEVGPAQVLLGEINDPSNIVQSTALTMPLLLNGRTWNDLNADTTFEEYRFDVAYGSGGAWSDVGAHFIKRGEISAGHQFYHTSNASGNWQIDPEIAALNTGSIKLEGDADWNGVLIRVYGIKAQQTVMGGLPVTNSATATAGQTLQANGDGTFTFV